MSQLKLKLKAFGLALLLIAPWQGVFAASSDYRGSIFVEMMLKMMEVMVELIDDDPNYSSSPYPIPNYYLNPYTNPATAMSAFSANPWANMAQGLAYNQMPPPFDPTLLDNFTGADLYNGGLSPQAVIPYMPGNQPSVTAPIHLKYIPHWIEGRWVASDNMVMEVWQGEFKMYYRNRPSQVRGGLIRLKDKWLAIFEKTHQITRQFEYAYQDDKLALKDSNGNLMLFHRSTNWMNQPR